jgi:hypothetical protein
VQFKGLLAFQDDAFLKRIQTQTQARAHYITAVFEDTHVYSFQPAMGQSYAQLLKRLRAMPEVARVEMDHKATAN